VHRLQAGLKDIEVTSFVAQMVPADGGRRPVMAGMTRRPGVPLGALTPNLQA
jgi:hypothetical protein